MIRRGKAPRKGEWAIPGGRQELGETVAEGARREVLEETGVTCRIAGLIDVVDGISRHADGSLIYHYTLIDMWGEWQAGEAVAASDAMAACFMPLTDVETLKLWPETRRIIAMAHPFRILPWVVGRGRGEAWPTQTNRERGGPNRLDR